MTLNDTGLGLVLWNLKIIKLLDCRQRNLIKSLLQCKLLCLGIFVRYLVETRCEVSWRYWSRGPGWRVNVEIFPPKKGNYFIGSLVFIEKFGTIGKKVINIFGSFTIIFCQEQILNLFEDTSPMPWYEYEPSQIFTFQEWDRMGRLKEMVAVTTKMVSNTDSIIRISL